jgi:hypothetical protein
VNFLEGFFHLPGPDLDQVPLVFSFQFLLLKEQVCRPHILDLFLAQEQFLPQNIGWASQRGLGHLLGHHGSGTLVVVHCSLVYKVFVRTGREILVMQWLLILEGSLFFLYSLLVLQSVAIDRLSSDRGRQDPTVLRHKVA